MNPKPNAPTKWHLDNRDYLLLSRKAARQIERISSQRCTRDPRYTAAPSLST